MKLGRVEGWPLMVGPDELRRDFGERRIIGERRESWHVGWLWFMLFWRRRRVENLVLIEKKGKSQRGFRHWRSREVEWNLSLLNKLLRHFYISCRVCWLHVINKPYCTS